MAVNQLTPLGLDSYSRYMVDVYDEREVMQVSTGFQSIFGNPGAGGKTLFSPDSEVVDIDIIRANRKIAALVNRGSNARRISGKADTNQTEWTSNTRVYPLAEEEGPISANKINKRVPNENPFERMTRIDRMRYNARSMHMEHIRRLSRLFEYLCSLSARTGQHPAILGTSNTDLIYDFQRSAGNTITVGTAWDDTSPDIFGDIDSACEAVRVNGKLTPDVMVIGGDALEAAINDTTFAGIADNRRFDLIEVSTNNPVPAKYNRYVESGMIARGRLRTPKGFTLWVFTYLDSWETNAGVDTKYMPEDQALIFSSDAQANRYFGPPENLPLSESDVQMYQTYFGFSPMATPMPPNIDNVSAVLNPAMFYCDAYRNANKKLLTIRTQAAPIYATTATDGFALLQGLIL